MQAEIAKSTYSSIPTKSVSSGILARAKDYYLLAKPKVLVLLLVSTVCPMFLAAAGPVSIQLIFFTLLGGALISGSAAAINCVWEADTDRLMERTKNRAVAAGRLSPMQGAAFAVIIGMIGLLVMTVFVNPVAASISLFGHFFYVFVYTIWLKPITPQNIVIGGAAGAVPPMVGWAAVSGSITLSSLLLFAIIFLWTPPHFWALALNKNADYRRAGIPMLPVVAGESITHRQMLAYAVSLLPVSMLLVLSNDSLGWFSMTVLLVLGVVFAWKTYELKCLGEDANEEKVAKAWDVFSFSLIYLTAFFVCLVVDSLVI
ncbi:UNVERIFIED_CONTAM: hypothetical protein GTU68_051644 [Idotea baltica]|nr:hypothetical protein [Idotea baltica]